MKRASSQSRSSSFEICILAGGLSQRMGCDKARLRLGRLTLLSHVRRAAERLRAPVRVIRRDAVVRCGPLGGMVTALRSTNEQVILFLTCDMPFVTAQGMEKVLSALEEDPSADGACACARERLGFPMALRRKALSVLEDSIRSRTLALQELGNRLKIRGTSVTGLDSMELFNVNTPSDWERAREYWAAAQGDRSSSPVKKDSSSRGDRGSRKTVLRVEGLSVFRGKVPIIKDVSWDVQKGENWVVMGANGSGKTSLLSALTGYLAPSSGEVGVLGEQYGKTDMRELRKRIGIVSSSVRQLMSDWEPALETIASGKDAIIDYWGKLSRQDKARARGLLAQIGCSHLEGRPWAFLSQGERQRVLIGRALMARPVLLILDEPCAGLDPAAREHFLQFLERLGKQRSAPALVLVTHHVEEIMPIFSHLLILRDGEVIAAGEIRRNLTSGNLSKAFGTRCRLSRSGNRFTMMVAAADRNVF